MNRPRIKLLTLWVGELPSYALDFAGRVRDLAIVDWELLWFKDVAQVNRLVTERLGTPCRKESGFALSDVRPMLAQVFPEKVRVSFDYWGWVELDVVLGDLDNLLPPLMDDHDAISCFDWAVSGPLMLFKNVKRCNELFHLGTWRQVLAEPSYCNFEETQASHVNQRIVDHPVGGMTSLFKNLDFYRVHWDDRHSLAHEGDPAHVTPAGCRLEGNKLIEVPTDRELLIYHFNHLKRWPVGLPVSETEIALERRKG